MPASPEKSATPCVRDRLLDAADRLFYQDGVQAVGIDRVLAEAGAAKASLYAHFKSKDDLIAAYVDRRICASRDAIEAWMHDVPPERRALHLFDFVVAWAESPDFHGCPMLHVVSDLQDDAHPARTSVANQRAWLLERITGWVRAAGVADAPRTAGALLTLFDGAVAASELDGSQRARDARWLAEQLLTR